MDSSESEEDLILLVALADEEDQRKRKIWTHEINLERHQKGEFHTRQGGNGGMKIAYFDEIVNLIREDISKLDINFRESISAEERLAITLRFLATGDSFSTIGHSYRVGFSTVSTIINEVCEAIRKRLQPIYLPEPTTEIWQKSAEDFLNMWQFPNCIGSLDGKHVTIKCPGKTGSNHFGYLKKFSIVLMAIVDANYKFICIDVGGYGKNSDGGIFQNSNMGQRFEAGLMNVPEDKNLPGQVEPCPHVLIGDEAFALKSFLMRPFPYKQSRSDRRKENYNTRLCRARRVVENAFGILAQKWRVFFRPIETKVETTISIVETCCILHNFLRTKVNQQGREFSETEENSGRAFINIERDPRRATNLAFSTREKFVNYFNI
ncbi:uncharacterized protein LOC126881914 [Diabrotica virgifera virgifera]|uniref:DDE Tnp4 domain-containing protein n=1 Tax=Diabrotica virgifera virgifera TaxID=50390 RepID=A0ABM5JXE1_DIAVI|nr:uncharacterized protein LOC126881914 [Diabrotica virgifera virgifera]